MSEDRAIGIVDAALFANFASESDIIERLPRGWREYLDSTTGNSASQTYDAASGGLSAGGSHSVVPSQGLTNPLGDKLASAFPKTGGLAGSDLGLTRADHLNPNEISRAVVLHDAAATLPTVLNPQLSVDLVRAYNDWMLEFLRADSRLFGALLVATQSPVAAAADIKEAAEDSRWVAVSLTANALAQPFGHPIYRPILSAAAEAALPVILYSGSEASMQVLAASTAGGSPSTYTDQWVLAGQPVASHIVSLIGQGVFEQWPELKVLAVGAGISWVTPLMWRSDTSYKSFRRDAPVLKLAPSQYFQRNVRVTTYPLERTAGPERLLRYLHAEPALSDILCYGSGYPNWDTDAVGEVRARLPAEWLPKVFATNANGLFRWPKESALPTVGARRNA